MCAAAKRKVVITAMQRIDGAGCSHPDVTAVNDSKTVESALAAGEVQLVAGTAWLFARPGMEESLDHLFVDEAGQMSLANVVAVGTATRTSCSSAIPNNSASPPRARIRLAQVSPRSSTSSTVRTPCRPERGLFLESTYRMHPDISAFVSALSYEDRLFSVTHAVGNASSAEARSVGTDCAGSPSNTQATSCRPTRRQRRLLAATSRSSEAVGSAPTASSGRSRSMMSSSLLRTTPRYTRSARLLPPGARVGTVDKFQGQEAAIVIVSMATSSAADAPRGLEFLLSTNRLNVAVSRARAMAIVVASPTLLDHRMQVAPSDPTRQRTVPLRRARARVSAAGLTIRPARLAASGCPPPTDRRCTTGGTWRGPARST